MSFHFHFSEERVRKRARLSWQNPLQPAFELHLKHGTSDRRLQLLIRGHQEEVHLHRRVSHRTSYRWRYNY